MDVLIFFAVFFAGCLAAGFLMTLPGRKDAQDARRREERRYHESQLALQNYEEGREERQQRATEQLAAWRQEREASAASEKGRL